MYLQDDEDPYGDGPAEEEPLLEEECYWCVDCDQGFGVEGPQDGAVCRTCYEVRLQE